MPDFIQIQTTTDARDDAQRIARALIEQRLAACVQIVGPITSTYRWEARVEVADEWLCVIKTVRDRYDSVERAIISLHPYDVPEIIAVPVIHGSMGYLEWVASEVATSHEL